MAKLNPSSVGWARYHRHVAFVPVRWRGYLEQAIADGDAVSYRHYWKLTVLLGLRDALRSGDVFVPGSRRYADLTSYLLTPGIGVPVPRVLNASGNRRVPKGAPTHDADQALAAVEDKLHTAFDDLDGALASGAGAVGLDEQGELIIPPLSAESIPEAAEALRIDLREMLPRTQIASLLIEIDRRTHFSDHLTHAGGKVTRSPELLRNLYAVLISQACNLGLTAMAGASGIPYDVLAWTADWYFREDTLRMASAAVVNHHHRLPMTQLWGTGTLSSSDGQRFPTRAKSITEKVPRA